VGGEERGYDGGKKVKGLKASHPGGHGGFRPQGKGPQCQGVMDHEGIKTLLKHADTAFPRLCHLWLEAGYRGEGKDWVQKTLGWSVYLVERPRKADPKRC
jgi:putative transposase